MKNVDTWSDIKNEVYGQIGTIRRDELDRDFKSFKIGRDVQFLNSFGN